MLTVKKNYRDRPGASLSKTNFRLYGVVVLFVWSTAMVDDADCLLRTRDARKSEGGSSGAVYHSASCALRVNNND